MKELQRGTPPIGSPELRSVLKIFGLQVLSDQFGLKYCGLFFELVLVERFPQITTGLVLIQYFLIGFLLFRTDN